MNQISSKNLIFTDRKGFSLVEAVVAMGLLGIFVATITSGLLLERRIAESAVYNTTAHTVTQGYMEQIKSIEYADILLILENHDLPLSTKSISVSSTDTGEEIEIDDPLFLDTWNEKEIIIDIKTDQEGNISNLTMPYKIRPTISDLNTGGNPVQALEVTLEYEYLSPARGEPQWLSGQVKFVKSYAPTF